MKKLFFLALVFLAFSFSVNAGICNPVITLNSPTADFEQEEYDAWSTSVTLTYTVNSGCGSIGTTYNMVYREPGSVVWNDITAFSNDNITQVGFSPRIRCFSGSCGTVSVGLQGKQVSDDWDIGGRFSTGSETKTDFFYNVNFTNETGLPEVGLPLFGGSPADIFAYNENWTIAATCNDNISDVILFELWTNGSGTWENISSNSEYVEDTLEEAIAFFSVDNTQFPYSARCVDFRGNIGWGITNGTVFTEFDNIAPNVTIIYPENDITQESGDLNFSCFATDRHNIVNMSLWGNFSGIWEINQTVNTSGFLPNEIDDITQESTINRITAFNADSYREFQVAMPIGYINPDANLTKGDMCYYQQSLETNTQVLNLSRVDDQGWTLFLSVGDYNSQSLTNQTNVTEQGGEGWHCIDVKEQLLTELSENPEGFLTMRVGMEEFTVGTATGLVNFFDFFLYVGNYSTDYWTMRFTDSDGETAFRPFINATWTITLPNETVAEYEIDGLSNGSYEWGCSAIEVAMNKGFSENRTFTISPGEPPSDTCSCPSINTNWALNLQDFCDIQTFCDIGTGNISWVDDNSGGVNFSGGVSFNDWESIPLNSYVRTEENKRIQITK